MLNEYETHGTLNPVLWDGDRLKPKVTKKLLRIAKHFYNFLETDAAVKDIIIIGSNANYNWTSNSDIDLHVVINYMEVGDNLHLVKNHMMAKKSVWNTNYPLTLHGMAIELYAQDSNEELHSSVGIYSLLKGKWIKRPSAKLISIDDSIIDQKVAPLKYQIDQLDKNDPNIRYKIKQILEHLRRMRQAGLDAEGEYSVENLAFKKLRTIGYIDKLKEMLKSLTVAYLQTESKHIHDPINSLAKHIKGESLLDEIGWQQVMQHTDAVKAAMGQWSHPGRCTMIPSSNITMHNVPHRVLGIDDTGHSIMMQPEQTYSYPGARVFEIPVTPQQHTLLIQLRNAIQNGARYAK
jgi:hypothetical protein